MCQTDCVTAKQIKDRRPFDIGLNRKGAIRQRKEEIHEQYGHKFVQQQFYNIMRCALCGDFLKYAAGMQCSDCKYTCHKKCYQKVVTKCITQSNAETDPDEAKLNHRIPHRFEPFANMGANWCCHCGYVLPFGKKQCRKCSGKDCRMRDHSFPANDCCRMWLHVSRAVRSLCPRFLWYVDGGRKPDSVRNQEHQEASDLVDIVNELEDAAAKHRHWPATSATVHRLLCIWSRFSAVRAAFLRQGFGLPGRCSGS